MREDTEGDRGASVAEGHLDLLDGRSPGDQRARRVVAEIVGLVARGGRLPNSLPRVVGQWLAELVGEDRAVRSGAVGRGEMAASSSTTTRPSGTVRTLLGVLGGMNPG